MFNRFPSPPLLIAIAILSGFARTAAADPPADLFSEPLSPEASLKEIVVRPGLRVELVAAEPLVVDPVAFAWGADGKFWVVEMNDYPLGEDGNGKPGGRIKFLDDDDGDGRYDRATVFLDELQYPTAVFPWRKGVIACAVPNIFYAEDRDGDGRAEHREVLYSGLHVGNSQHLANGLRWGPDGWLHCANGATKTAIKSEKSGKVVNLGIRDFRIHPDSGDIEPLAGRSQYVRECDDWGNWFGSMNSEPLFHFVLEEKYLRRNPHGVYPSPLKIVPEQSGAAPVYPISRTVTRFNDLNKANRFTSACGLTIYRDTLLGDEFYGNAFICEPVHNLVHREVLEPDGVSFKSRLAADEQKSEFLASRDPWFRPVMARTGPDGALYIADMYRLVIEHPEWIPKDWQAKLDLRAGSDKGRIYRVLPKNGEPRPMPRMEINKAAKAETLVEHLENPNGVVRDLAMQQIVQLASKLEYVPFNVGILPASRVADSSDLASARLAGVATLRLLDSARFSLSDSDSRVYARKLESVLNTLPYENAANFAVGAFDDDVRVRLASAARLGDGVSPMHSRTLSIILRTEDDPYVIATAVSSLSPANIATVTELAMSDAARVMQPPKQLVAMLVDPVIGFLDTKALSRLIRGVVETERKTDRLDAAAALIEGLARHRLSLKGMAERPDADLAEQADALRLMIAVARQDLRNPKAGEAMRVRSLALLGYVTEQRDTELIILTELLSPQTPEALRAGAVTALTRFDVPEAADLLLARWNTFGGERKRQVLAACLNRNSWAERLVTAVTEKRIPAVEIDVTSSQRLLNHPNQAIREAATKALASSIDPDRAKVVERYLEAAKLTGDVAHGKQVFTKSCGPCHRIGDVGHNVGPDLAALSDRSAPSLLTSIFDPNRAVESKYVAYTAVTVDGLSFNGVLVEETDSTVTLALADGKQQQLRRDELDEFVSSSKSLMPVGVEKDVAPQDAADMLAFLAASRTPPKSLPGNTPRLVRPEALRGELFLLAEAAEAYGETLSFTASPPRLNSWISAGDRAEWEFEITQPGNYEASIEYGCPTDGGGVFVASITGTRFSAKVEPTGGVESYRVATLGPVQLAAGRHRAVVRSDGPIAPGGLFELSSLRLRRK